MQVAVLSDIHANRHALEAVLDDVRRTGARELWCLGDLVGYGADPNDCVALVREHVSVCIAGNHDLAVTGELPLDDFSAGAALAAGWTREVIAPDHLEYLESLRPQLITDEADLYHGSPRDPIWEYVVGVLLAELCLDRLEGRIGLIGHSHIALSFAREEGSPATGLGAPRGRHARHQLRLVAAQPGQRRPAARRRSARGLAAAGPHAGHRVVAPHGVRRRRRGRRDPCRAAA